MKRTVLVVTLAVAALAVVPAYALFPATADGNGHPNVGILVAEWQTPGVKDRLCTGTLIAPRIFLTAAHCNPAPEAPVDQVWVSFDPVYTFDDSTLYHGTFVPNPDFYSYSAAGATAKDPNDVAVVVLDEAPPVTPATLPPAGLLSRLDLRGQTFTIVGYGRTRIDKTKGPNNIVNQWTRNVGTDTFRSLQPLWLMQDANPSTGNDTTCYGDSGGPHFLGDSNMVVAITATGDIPCRANDVSYRLDTPSARRYLAAQGIALP
jgi:hypothetical protein